jgi:hypothetical protein
LRAARSALSGGTTESPDPDHSESGE